MYYMVSKLILAALVPAMASCAYVGGTAVSENTVEKNVAVSDFHALSVGGAMKVTYSSDSISGVSVSAPENVMPWIVVESNDGKLEVYMKSGHPNFFGHMRVEVTAKSQVLTYAGVSGASSFTAGNITAESFGLSVSGASKAEITGMHAQDMKIEVSGASKANVSGIAGGRLDADVSGASKAILSGKCGQADLSASGASKVDASGLAAESISRSATGASEVTAQ